ncbi:hypothetical protein D6779_08980 [Candidatus Parcubacteria bacterium]|nr:MAG: hypothetical protein D6779_08980 [Candidatus Parcubacteria bacterium]
MSNFFSKILHSGVVAGSRLGSGFVVAKLLAVYGSASGAAVFFQFQNLLQFGGGISGNGIGQGLVRHLAESDDVERRRRFFSVGVGMGMALAAIGSAVVAGVILMWGENLLGERGMDWAWLAFFGVFLTVLASISMQALNGLDASSKMAWVAFASAMVGVGGVWYGLVHGGIKGAVEGSLLGMLAGVLFAWVWLKRADLVVRWKAWTEDGEARRSLLGYVAMSVSAAVSIPVVLVVVRSALAEHTSWTVAGYWSMLWRLSEAYLLAIVTLLQIYYLPRLAAAKTKADVYAEVRGALVRFVPMVSLVSFLVYWFREPIIRLVLSEEFMPMASLMPWQLLGDVLKIITWIFGNYIWAKGHVAAFVVSELGFAWLYAGLSLTMIWYGLGALSCVIAFVAVYAVAIPVYFIWMVCH